MGAMGAMTRRRRVSPVTLVALVMLMAGIALVGNAAWEFYGTGIVTMRAVEQEKGELSRQWAMPTSDGMQSPVPAPGDAPAPGSTAWLIRIPRLGQDYEWPVVAGVEPEDLAKGVGWFPTSALPGEIGNFALAGHRVTHGEPFRNLLDLRVGDDVIVETREAVFTYRITNAPKDLTVDFTESWVLDPVPGSPGSAPTKAMITLTTCQSFFHTPDRSVAFGVLESAELK